MESQDRSDIEAMWYVQTKEAIIGIGQDLLKKVGEGL